KLDRRAEIACIGNHCLHTLKRLFSTQAKLVLKMDIRGCKKHMDNWLFSLTNALPSSLDIASIGTSKASNSCTPNTLSDLFDFSKIARRCSRKTSFNDVYIECY